MTRTYSIAIPTFRRPDDLARTLRSILRERVASPGWDITEIIVVDNDSDESARATVAALSAERPFVRYVAEPTPGISAARNRALSEANADVLVMIDDDATLASSWPAGLLETLGDTGAVLVGGPVLPKPAIEVEPWILEAMSRSRHPDGALVERVGSGNIAIDLRIRNLMDPVFDPAFGLTGGSDTKLCADLAALGERIAWSDRAEVFEHYPAERCTGPWVIRRWERGGETMTAVALAEDPGFRNAAHVAAGALLRSAAGTVVSLAGLSRRSVQLRRRGDRWRALARGQRRALRGRRSIAYGADGFDSPGGSR